MTDIQLAKNLPMIIPPKNIVIREVCDFNGKVMGYASKEHNGSPEDIIKTAEKLTAQLEYELDGWSNVNSRIFATDEKGLPRWAISPNFRHIAEIGTLEARSIWGDMEAFKALEEMESK